MKTASKKVTARMMKLVTAVAYTFITAGAVNATLISQTFIDGVEGGVVTFEDTGPNQLTLTFDNTSSLYNGVITGIVFNIDAHINATSIFSFVDGNGDPITGWQVGVDVDNNITPGNTVFDISFDTTNGINGGIYNDGVATDFNNVVPDIATLILTITDPDPWVFSSIGDDSILRMQRTGENGQGSLKIDTSSSSTSSSSTSSTSNGSSGVASSGNGVPEPGVLGLLGAGLLGQVWLMRRRRAQ